MYIKNKSLATPIDLQKDKLENCIIIDLRSRGYFLISHITDALNLDSLTRIGFIAKENPDKRIVLYCHSGASAADFGSKLVEMGYKNIFYLDENFFNLPKLGVSIQYNT